MNRMSKLLGFALVAGCGLAMGLVAMPDGRASVSGPVLHVSPSSADLDHAHGAFDTFRNRLDQAPRQDEAAGKQAAIRGERADSARHTWPYIPQACQTSASGGHLRQIRTVALDQTTN